MPKGKNRAPRQLMDESQVNAPTTDPPTTDAPLVDAPLVDAPTTDAPTTDAPPTGKPTVDPNTPAGKPITLADMRFVGMTGSQLIAARQYMPAEVFLATFKAAWDAYGIAELAQLADTERASDRAGIAALVDVPAVSLLRDAYFTACETYRVSQETLDLAQKSVAQDLKTMATKIAALAETLKPAGVDVIPSTKPGGVLVFQSAIFTAKYGVATAPAVKAASNGHTNGPSTDDTGDAVMYAIIQAAGRAGAHSKDACMAYKAKRGLASVSYSIGAVCAAQKADGRIVNINGVWYAREFAPGAPVAVVSVAIVPAVNGEELVAA